MLGRAHMGQQRKKQESNNRLPKGRGGRHGNSDVHIVTHVAERRGRVERSQRDRSVGAINTSFTLLEKAMAPHSRTLAWRIPWMGEPGGLPSVGSHRVRHD